MMASQLRLPFISLSSPIENSLEGRYPLVPPRPVDTFLLAQAGDTRLGVEPQRARVRTGGQAPPLPNLFALNESNFCVSDEWRSTSTGGRTAVLRGQPYKWKYDQYAGAGRLCMHYSHRCDGNTTADGMDVRDVCICAAGDGS